jgi:TPR repeat protein
VMYAKGKGVPLDYKTAVKWYRLAAEQGYASAQHNLGFMYVLGRGVLKNNIRAHMWWSIAASSGESKKASKNRDKVAKRMTPSQIADAQKLARECVRKKYKRCDSGDYATALREWTPLAEQGFASAQFNLGRMYETGKGVPQDYKTAARWYRLAAEQGDVLSQFNLGVLYAKGWGVWQNNETATRWYRLAAEQGNAKAQYNLGHHYANGNLGNNEIDDDNYASSIDYLENYKIAARWYKLAAEQGFAPAQANLGAMYAFGKGVQKNYSTAFIWAYSSYKKGSGTGYKLKRFLRLKHLSSAEHYNALKLARECIRKEYKGC